MIRSGRFRMGVVVLAAVLLSGCSAYMAANQPSEKDFSVFKTGTPRDRVLAEFGTPKHSEIAGGRKSDIFTFVQGYHGAVKAGRAVAHGVASVATLGLWEIIGTPIEGHMNGSELSVRVDYDAADQVAAVIPLKGDDEVARNLPGALEAAPGSRLPAEQAATGSIR